MASLPDAFAFLHPIQPRTTPPTQQRPKSKKSQLIAEDVEDEAEHPKLQVLARTKHNDTSARLYLFQQTSTLDAGVVRSSTSMLP